MCSFGFISQGYLIRSIAAMQIDLSWGYNSDEINLPPGQLMSTSWYFDTCFDRHGTLIWCQIDLSREGDLVTT